MSVMPSTSSKANTTFFPNALESILIGTDKKTGTDYLTFLAEHLAKALELDMVTLIKCESKPIMDVESIALWEKDDDVSCVKYQIESSHCKSCNATLNNQCLSVLRENVSNRSKKENSYSDHISTPIYLSEKELFGHLIGFRKIPFPRGSREAARQIMNIFAGRVETEICRIAHEEKKTRWLEKLTSRNADLKAANRILTQSDQSKNDLVRMVAHDLKSPLNQVEGLLNILEASFQQLGESDKQLLSMMHESIFEMKSRINKVLDKESISSGTIDLQLEPVPLKNTVTHWIQNMGILAKELKVEVVSELCDTHVWADLQFLSHIIQNVLSNAIKYSNRGGIVTISSVTEEQFCTLSINDNGKGIKEEEKALVFEKGRTTSNTTEATEGAHGFGMFFTKKVVELMNGDIWFESEFGKGTTFFIKLPLPHGKTSDKEAAKGILNQ